MSTGRHRQIGHLHVSVEKHSTLNQMIDDLLDLQVIQPRATAWSQGYLVCKPTNGWRFTLYFRNLNEVISNKGWQIPNMSEMIERISNSRQASLAITDSTSGNFQMPLDKSFRQYTAFVTFRGIFGMDQSTNGPTNSSKFLPIKHGYSTVSYTTYVRCTLWRNMSKV